jgi:hypothetical protein
VVLGFPDDLRARHDCEEGSQSLLPIDDQHAGSQAWAIGT